MTSPKQQRAKRYEAIHNVLFAVETVLTGILLAALLFTGVSKTLADWTRSVSANPWLHVALYGAAVLCAGKLIFLPLRFFDGFCLEHRFGLSNQSLAGWLLDQAKSFGLSLVLGVIVLDVLYFLLRTAGDWWWAAAGVFFLVFGVVMSAVFPVLILPLFFKLEPLENESLKRKLVELAGRVNATVLGVYRIAMSAKTKKANAALAGLGRTKRIVLGDTLLDEFPEDEIEVVMAHELAHYKHRDVWKLIAWSTLTTFVGLRIADWGLRIGLARFGFEQISDIAAFPLLAMCLFLFGLVIMPVNNAFSRWREREADRKALELTANREAFIRAMARLAEKNLADLSPHPVIEFLLHDHPSLARRIARAEKWKRAKA
jgi:STE24 endopeptidase